MSIHAKVHHPDEPRLATNFKMIPLKTINKPMDRQITEALNIANANVDILLNSGSEWRSGSEGLSNKAKLKRVLCLNT